MSNRTAALKVERCAVCGDLTMNQPYKGKVLCDFCEDELDKLLDRGIEQLQLMEVNYEPFTERFP